MKHFWIMSTSYFGESLWTRRTRPNIKDAIRQYFYNTLHKVLWIRWRVQRSAIFVDVCVCVCVWGCGVCVCVCVGGGGGGGGGSLQCTCYYCYNPNADICIPQELLNYAWLNV